MGLESIGRKPIETDGQTTGRLCGASERLIRLPMQNETKWGAGETRGHGSSGPNCVVTSRQHMSQMEFIGYAMKVNRRVVLAPREYWRPLYCHDQSGLIIDRWRFTGKTSLALVLKIVRFHAHSLLTQLHKLNNNQSRRLQLNIKTFGRRIHARVARRQLVCLRPWHQL